MTFLEIILIGVALAMDAFAITISNCTTHGGKLNYQKSIAMPIFFALFQFAMPIIGFYLGSIFASSLTAYAGYITAGVFFVLTAKIVIDKLSDKDDNESKNFSYPLLTLQAVATSIDALIIGVTFAITLSSPFIASLVIGAVTFVIVWLGVFLGKRLGKALGEYAEWAGALILFAIALKNFIQTLIG